MIQRFIVQALLFFSPTAAFVVSLLFTSQARSQSQAIATMHPVTAADGTATAPKGPWNATRGKGVRIAILDSGVDPNHPDISPNLIFNLSEVNRATLPSL